jgi:hypothetical protein
MVVTNHFNVTSEIWMSDATKTSSSNIETYEAWSFEALKCTTLAVSACGICALAVATAAPRSYINVKLLSG